MSTFATVIGLAAAVCTTGANLPQLKKAWTTGETDDISLKTLLLLACGLGLWVLLAGLCAGWAAPALRVERRDVTVAILLALAILP
jgi:uncharacterized protein with PQ loop repeat